MDTSETYIKMSEKARKYLPPHVLSEGDFYSPDGVNVKVWCYEYQEDGTPLLRQDQLQEMVPVDVTRYAASGAFQKVVLFTEFITTDFGATKHCTSMEQLWLAYVMKEKGKVWDGEEWLA